MSSTTTSRRSVEHAGAPPRRLVLVVRADPVICGHSVEARNLAEAALQRGFTDVRIVTWPLERLREIGLPLKPSIETYSPGITVERPTPVGGYKVPDGRLTQAMTGRLVELFSDGVPTVAMSLYLMPHAMVVRDALEAARGADLPTNVVTINEAVGSDITHIVRDAVAEGRLGVAASLFTTYLSADVCVAVSEYTRAAIIEGAAEVDRMLGTRFAEECRARVEISYPAIDTAAYTDLNAAQTDRLLSARGLRRGGYLLFLSRLTPAKGVDDLLAGYERSGLAGSMRLVIAGNGPAAAELRARAAASPVAEQISFVHDVSDAEKPHLMAGCAAYALPSKPRPEFVETFGIALAEQMLSGGGPVITTATGGIPEAVGDTAFTVPIGSPEAIAIALQQVAAMTSDERSRHRTRARVHAMQFDRAIVLDRLLMLAERSGAPTVPDPRGEVVLGAGGVAA